jgi:hypothetical protein
MAYYPATHMLRNSTFLILLISLSVACVPTKAAITPTLVATLDSKAITTDSAKATRLVAFPIQGSILIEAGMCCIGGPVGEPIDITVSFDATSPFAAVTHMRTADQCLTAEDMAMIAWEPFADTKVFQFTPPVFNWFSFNVSVQFKDADGNLSPVYCDDIGVEGMPVTPTPKNP